MPPFQSMRSRIKNNPGVLKQGAQMMAGQARSKRREFDSWPKFVQRTFWHVDAKDGFDPIWRNFPVAERFTFAERLKKEGNELYSGGKCEDAIERYSQAAGLFHYVQRKGLAPDGNVDDLYVNLVSDGQDDAAVRNFRATCYSNIAQCLLRQSKPNHEAAIRACDEALLLEPNSAKTYYRRALAKESLGDTDSLEAALGDLAQAEALGDQGAAVKVMTQRIRAELRKQSNAEKRMYGGFLQKASLGGTCEKEERVKAEREADAAAASANEDLQKRLDSASRLREVYLAAGREADAQQAERAIERYQDRLLERKDREFDIFRPSAELKEEAREYGINLDDPEEREQLDRLMWDVQRVTHSSDDGQQSKAHDSSDKNTSRAMRAAWDLLFFLVLLGGLSWVWMAIRGQAFGP